MANGILLNRWSVSNSSFLFIFNFILMNIFVAKLNYRTSSEALENLFSQYGEVTSAKVIMDKDTGRSKGFAFVEMGLSLIHIFIVQNILQFNLISIIRMQR